MVSLTHDQRSFLSPSVRLGGVFDVVVVLALLGTWIGWLGRWFWFFDLFDHFRLQYTLLCFIALLWLGLRRRWMPALFALASLLANAWPIARTTWVSAPSQTVDATWGLKVVCFNALFNNTQLDDERRYLVDANADIIVLLEFSPALERALEPLQQTHPHGIRKSDDSPWGIGMYSRFPLKEITVRTFADEEPLSIEAIAEVNGKLVRVIAAHPWPPSSSRSLAKQRDQLRAIAAHVQSNQDMPVLLVGDFNATPWSQGIGILRERGQLDFRQPGPAWWPTWSVGKPFMLPIDLALCSAPLVISERSIGPDLGSDHRPQVLTLKWAK